MNIVQADEGPELEVMSRNSGIGLVCVVGRDAVNDEKQGLLATADIKSGA